jgi:hypothetical protein
MIFGLLKVEVEAAIATASRAMTRMGDWSVGQFDPDSVTADNFGGSGRSE